MKNPFKRKNKNEKTALAQAPRSDVVLQSEQGLPRPGRSEAREEKQPDAYYEKLASRMRIARYVTLVLLLVFAISMAFFYRSEITAENFGLLFRNASFSFPGEKKAFDTVRYDADLQMDYAIYKEYFASATTTCMRMYDHRGNVVLENSASMKNPTFVSGKKFLLLYDREGKNYSVFNSVATLKEDTLEHPLYGADMSDSGSYLLVTSSGQYLSVISVFNSSFNLRTTLNFDLYPQEARLSGDAKRLVFLSYGTDQAGAFEGHVSFFDLSSQPTVKKAEHIYGSVPLSCAVTDKGAAVLFSDHAVFYDLEGRETGTLAFEGLPKNAAFGDGCFALHFEGDKVKKENRIVVYDLTNGKKLGEASLFCRVKGIWLAGGMLYAGENELLHCIDYKSGEEKTLGYPLPDRIVSADGALFLCYKNKAENILPILSGLWQENLPGGASESAGGE